MDKNIELKDILDMIHDSITSGEDLFTKSYFSLFGDAFHLMGDLHGALSNLSDLKDELLSLPNNPELQLDLLSYTSAWFPNGGSDRVQLILAGSIKVASDLIQLTEDSLELKKVILIR